MNECDHIVGYDYIEIHYVRKSELHSEYKTQYKFCPECGEKLKESE
jgi:NADH pyrophosphatase NudC (nudix superfamily)